MKQCLVAGLLVIGACVVVPERGPQPPAVLVTAKAEYRAAWLSYYKCDESNVDFLVKKGWHYDDISVGLFLAHRSGKTVQDIELRRVAGYSWWKVMEHIKLDVMTLHTKVPDSLKIGPPYGNAYGYFRKQDATYLMTDEDVRNLVHLKVMTEHHGLDAALVIDHRGRGRTFNDLYKEHHDKGKGK